MIAHLARQLRELFCPVIMEGGWQAVSKPQLLKTGWMNQVPPACQLSTSPLSQPGSLQYTCSTCAKKRTMENKGKQEPGNARGVLSSTSKIEEEENGLFLFFVFI